MDHCQSLREVLPDSCIKDIEVLLFRTYPRPPFIPSPFIPSLTLASRTTIGTNRLLNPHNSNILSICHLARDSLQPPRNSKETNTGL
ncbi:unnamed protein product [Tuber melanosporum]|uniref:(Perigord truffle) hypothetical protein n=1 Tax=Tuber melanosporum (strain Mel28) TaxID=656061 RepID=D5GEF8_TUBMM|nr:uncharacterized protein GSTUM_00006467001 [Tuber melanosporum]CAZ82901.1 unnamed protein product [Tuber melanosporum]